MLKEQYETAEQSARPLLGKWVSGDDGLYAILGDPKSRCAPAIAPTEEIQ